MSKTTVGAPCCPPGSLPMAKSTAGDAVGKVFVIEGSPSTNQASTNVYVTGTPLAETRRIVVVFSDVFGYDSGRHFQFADELSQLLGKDTSVVIPDIFRGVPCMQPSQVLPEKLSMVFGAPAMLYRAKFRYHATYVDAIVNELIIPWLKKASSETVAFSAVGFCFGAWVLAKTVGEEHLWKCGVGIHPAFNLERLHGGSQDSLAKEVGNFPYFLMPAGNDPDNIKPGGSCVQIMAAMRDVAEEEVSCNFPDMVHGFSNRGDPNDPIIAKQQQLALKKTATFIQLHHKL